jgi:hypothetical protein
MFNTPFTNVNNQGVLGEQESRRAGEQESRRAGEQESRRAGEQESRKIIETLRQINRNADVA